ncbi:hypothetical protein HDU67_006630 [Dinochytrium kinnereticum]|nr:hypothetical protein HDU67_006630 [Dinochytrium kinnereticum]
MRLPSLEAIASVLPSTPRGYGIPCKNRTHWTALIRSKRFFNMTQVEQGVARYTPFPAWNNTAYLTFMRTGDPGPGREMIPDRMNGLGQLALAECVFWNGSFTDRINQALLSVALQPSWETPENDPKLFLFNGRGQHFNLYAGPTVGILSQIVHLLGDKIRGNVVDAIRTQSERRIFAPSRLYFQKGVLVNWTFENIFISESNRNPLTFSGVLIAALNLIRDVRDRAVMVRGIATFVQRYLLTVWDGYMEEGLGYYGLGFGSYLEVRELLFDATKGTIDILNFETAAYAALYPTFFAMNMSRNPWACLEPGLSRFLLGYTRNVFNLTGPREHGPMAIVTYFNTMSMGYALGTTPPRPPSAIHQTLINRILSQTKVRHNPHHRTVYNTAGVVIGRPGREDSTNTTSNMYYALNTCGNGASHDHAAVGAYVLSVNGRNILGDPGGPAFYGPMFYKDRYNSAFTNACGHPVPVVGGFFQERGMLVCQKIPYPSIISHSFTDHVDTVTIDMALAYPEAWMMSGLRRLQRTVTYDRRGRGRLTVMDTVMFDQSIGTMASKTIRAVTTGNKNSRFVKMTARSGIMWIPGERWRVNVTLVSPNAVSNAAGGKFEIGVEDVVDVDTRERWPVISTLFTRVQSARVGFVFEPIL